MLIGPLKTKDLMEPSEIPLSPEAESEVTVGGDDVLLSGVSTKKRSQDQVPIEKEKRKGMLSGEAYSRAVDRSVIMDACYFRNKHSVTSSLYTYQVEERGE